jgi:hypothetical protein
MTLYTVTQPNPPVGHDFRFVVPGRYLYDVVGITATLLTDTPETTHPVDYSGHHRDGTYVTVGGPARFSPASAFPSDACLVSSDLPLAAYSAGFNAPAAAMPITAGSFTLGFWRNTTANAGPGIEWVNVGVGICAQAFNGNSTVLEWDSMGGTGGWTTDIIPALLDGAWHFVAYVYDAGTQEMTIYVDGALVPQVSDIPGTPFGDIPTQVQWDTNGGSTPSGTGMTDEIFFTPNALTAGQIAGLYGTAPDFAAWTAAVLGYGPTVAYHLDGIRPGTGRQPSLIVTNGTTELEAIPTGFPAVATPGPYEYSWQPNLNADIQSTDGTLTTVAIPQLLLPAGYTVGTRTLDLTSTDQWSNIALWWDDAYQAAFDPFNQYDFPGGIKLVYQQQGVAP